MTINRREFRCELIALCDAYQSLASNARDPMSQSIYKIVYETRTTLDRSGNIDPIYSSFVTTLQETLQDSELGAPLDLNPRLIRGKVYSEIQLNIQDLLEPENAGSERGILHVVAQKAAVFLHKRGLLPKSSTLEETYDQLRYEQAATFAEMKESEDDFLTHLNAQIEASKKRSLENIAAAEKELFESLSSATGRVAKLESATPFVEIAIPSLELPSIDENIRAAAQPFETKLADLVTRVKTLAENWQKEMGEAVTEEKKQITQTLQLLQDVRKRTQHLIDVSQKETKIQIAKTEQMQNTLQTKITEVKLEAQKVKEDLDEAALFVQIGLTIAGIGASYYLSQKTGMQITVRLLK